MKKLLILLLLSTSFSTFAGSQLDFTLSDFCYQQPGVQDRRGVYYFPNEEVGISATSVCVYKDVYGQYQSKGKLIKGKFDGKWTFWNENGQKDYEVNYKDGKEDGKRTTSWYENGQIKTEGIYKDGKQISETRYTYHNDRIDSEENYKDAKFVNKTKYSYYGNGQIKEKTNYDIDFILNGKQTSWFENGQKEYEQNYKDGKLGKSIFWYFMH